MTQAITPSKYIFSLLFTCLALLGQAQTDTLPVIDYSEAKVYEIGGIKVTGNNFSDENAIISVAGLKVGNQISVPGVDIRSAIRALWKLKLFTDIQIVKNNVSSECM